MLDILRTLDVLLERHTCIYAVGTKELGNRDRKRSITLKSTETITLKPPRKSNKNLRILLYVIRWSRFLDFCSLICSYHICDASYVCLLFPTISATSLLLSIHFIFQPKIKKVQLILQ
jgi:hypothetical protein